MAAAPCVNGVHRHMIISTDSGAFGKIQHLLKIKKKKKKKGLDEAGIEEKRGRDFLYLVKSIQKLQLLMDTTVKG